MTSPSSSTDFDDVSPGYSTPVPDGFRPVQIGGAFIAGNGPLYAKWTGKLLLLGFRVEERHTNPLKICHGGMLATFADMVIPCAAFYQADMASRFLPTVSLQVDYMGAAKLGAWVEGEAQILRTTRNLLFGQALVTADGEPALRVSGIFKLGQILDNGTRKDPFGFFAKTT
jgi:uncharacterized protein (TIGR00369 family)